MIDAAGRELRRLEPGLSDLPAHERTAAVMKLDIVKYHLSVEHGIMRAFERRPTKLGRSRGASTRGSLTDPAGKSWRGPRAGAVRRLSSQGSADAMRRLAGEVAGCG